MKTKKIIIICIVVTIAVATATFFITKGIYNKDTEKNIDIDADFVTRNLKEYNEEIPEFSFVIRGLYSGTITNTDIKSKGIKVYEFEGKAEYSWGYNISTYVGIKLSDVLKAFDITEYNELLFKSVGRLEITYPMDEITDDSYLILLRSYEPIGDYDVNFVDFNYLYNFAVEGLVEIDVK